VAGRYVSWSAERRGNSSQRIVVADRLTGRVVLRVRRSGRGARRAQDHDLRRDGLVAVLVTSRPPGPRFRTDLVVATPARPAPRTVRRDVSGTRVEVAGGRAAVALLDERTKERALAIVPLAGRARPRVVASFPRGRTMLLRRFAFDGRRIAWAEADTDHHGDAHDATPARVRVLDARR
jgi:hypothetical protein